MDYGGVEVIVKYLNFGRIITSPYLGVQNLIRFDFGSVANYYSEAPSKIFLEKISADLTEKGDILFRKDLPVRLHH